jgi:indole-3-glycerol phosphate synthase
MASLDRMISSSRRALEQRRGARPLAQLEEAVVALDPIRPFTEAIVGEEIAFVLRVADADPALLAEAGAAGVAGLAVVGDAAPAGFEDTSLPVLHRGVLIDPYQLYESRLGGADGVVLIAEAFDDDDDEFAEMQMVAAQLGLDVVVQVADEDEVEHVLELLDPDSFLIQNLREGREVPDFEHTFSLLEEVPAGKVVLSAGGIKHRDEVLALESAGVDAAILGRWVQRHGIASTLDILRGDTRG